MGLAYEYEVTACVPEVDARVWDVVVVRGDGMYLCRKRGGEVRARRMEGGRWRCYTDEKKG